MPAPPGSITPPSPLSLDHPAGLNANILGSFSRDIHITTLNFAWTCNYHHKMGLIKCVDCGTEVSDAAPACVKCGRPVASRNTETSRGTSGMVGAAVGTGEAATGRRGTGAAAGASSEAQPARASAARANGSHDFI